MNNHSEMNDQNLDNRLADFVDKLLRGKSDEIPTDQGIDLGALQETVIKLKIYIQQRASCFTI